MRILHFNFYFFTLPYLLAPIVWICLRPDGKVKNGFVLFKKKLFSLKENIGINFSLLSSFLNHSKYYISREKLENISRDFCISKKKFCPAEKKTWTPQ